jgi:anthranilate phosphoribosyltransferase
MGLRTKGETVDEITGSAKVMREVANAVVSVHVDNLIDTCGTGGDESNTFNISTTVAFVAAAAGIPVAKHGNRSVSSQSGSADVLKALGVNINLTAEQVAQCIEEIGIGFMFAPNFHPSMKHAIGPRREMGIRTIFNILGPLTNPANAKRQVVGVFDPALTEPLAKVLKELGVKHAYVVHGAGGLDEFSTIGLNRVSHLNHGEIRTYDLDPTEFGLHTATLDQLQGGDAEENAEITREILVAQGVLAHRETVILNSAAALVVGGVCDNLKDGVEKAASIIESGDALEKLDALVEFTQQFAE